MVHLYMMDGVLRDGDIMGISCNNNERKKKMMIEIGNDEWIVIWLNNEWYDWYDLCSLLINLNERML